MNVKSRKFIFLILAANLLATVANAHTKWTINLVGETMVEGDGTFTANETTYGSVFSGGYHRYSSGFIEMSVTARTTNADPSSVPATIYAVEIPGVALIVQPILQGIETQIIALAGQSTCPPTKNIATNWVFTQWNNNFSYDLSNQYQPALGTMDWDVSAQVASMSPGRGALDNIFSLANLVTPLPIGGPVYLSGVCNGTTNTMEIPGAGSRGGELFFTNRGGLLFKNLAGQLVVGLPRIVIPHVKYLQGDYAGFRWQSGVSNVEKMHMTIGAGGLSFSGNGLVSPTNLNGGSTGVADSIAVSQTNGINSPINGMFRGTINSGGHSGVIVCSTMLNVLGRNALFCAGQGPVAAASKPPYNLLLVSSATSFLVFEDGGNW